MVGLVPRRDARPGVRAALLGLTTLALLAVGAPLAGPMAHVAGGSTGSYASPAGARLSPTVSAGPTCAAINSNGSLNATYTQTYDGLPATQTDSAGAPYNTTAEQGKNAYPNLTTGDRQLVDAWNSICGSAAYTALYDQWGPSSIFSGGQLLSNGFYQVNFGFSYHASCSNSTDNSSSACQWSSTWYVNLSGGQLTGPILTQDHSLPSGAPPVANGTIPPRVNRAVPPAGSGTVPPRSVGLSRPQELVIVALVAAVVLGPLAAVRMRR